MQVAALRSARRLTGRRAAMGRRARRVALRVSAVNGRRRDGLRLSAASVRHAGSRASAVNGRHAGSKVNALNGRHVSPKASEVSVHHVVSKVNARRVVLTANVASAPRVGWKAIGHPVAMTQSVIVASGRPAFHAMKVRAALRLAAHAAPMTPVVPAPRAPAAQIRVLVANAPRVVSATIRASEVRRRGHALAPTVVLARNAAHLIGPRATTARAALRRVHATSARLRRNAVRSSVVSVRLPSRSRVATGSARSATALARPRAALHPPPDLLAPRKRHRVHPHPAANMTMHRARCACRS